MISKLASKTFYATAVFGCLSQSFTAALNSAESDQALSLHNDYRRTVEPKASNCGPLSWDAGLAASAQSVANQCSTEHSNWEGRGENLAWGWPSLAVNAGLGLWYGEKNMFNINGSPIAAGHYTAMVWATTTKVGCAKTDCSSLAGKGPGSLIVCHYNPPGNYRNSAGLIGAPYEVAVGGVDSEAVAQKQAAAQPVAVPTPTAVAVEPTPIATPVVTPAAAPVVDTFHWQAADSFGSCSATCGQGVQGRAVTCQNQNGVSVDFNNCAAESKPADSQSCELMKCPEPVTYSWLTSDFSVCSSACDGSQWRSVVCSTNTKQLVSESLCSGPKPANTQSCNGECPKAAPKAVVVAPVAAPVVQAKVEPISVPVAKAAPVAAAVPVVTEPAAPVAAVPVEVTISVANTAFQCDNSTATFVQLLNDTAAVYGNGFVNLQNGAANCSAVASFINSTQVNLFNCSSQFNTSLFSTLTQSYKLSGDFFSQTLSDCLTSLLQLNVSSKATDSPSVQSEVFRDSAAVFEADQLSAAAKSTMQSDAPALSVGLLTVTGAVLLSGLLW